MYVWGQHTEQFGFNLMPSPWSVINSTPYNSPMHQRAMAKPLTNMLGGGSWQ